VARTAVKEDPVPDPAVEDLRPDLDDVGREGDATRYWLMEVVPEVPAEVVEVALRKTLLDVVVAAGLPLIEALLGEVLLVHSALWTHRWLLG
jgi:hypothetical protein